MFNYLTIKVMLKQAMISVVIVIIALAIYFMFVQKRLEKFSAYERDYDKI